MASTILIFAPLLLILLLMLLGYKRIPSQKLSYVCLGLFAFSIAVWIFSIATGVKDQFCEITGTCFDIKITSEDTTAEFYIDDRLVGPQGVCVSNLNKREHRVSVKKDGELSTVIFKGSKAGVTPQLVRENDGKSFSDVGNGFSTYALVNFTVLVEECEQL